MAIEQYRSESRSVYTEYLFVRYLRSQFRVQGMYSLNHKNIILTHLKFLAALLALTRLEVILRQLHFFSGKEVIQLLVKQRYVQSIKALIVIFSLIILRRFLSVNEIIIKRNRYRLYTICKQLY